MYVCMYVCMYVFSLYVYDVNFTRDSSVNVVVLNQRCFLEERVLMIEVPCVRLCPPLYNHNDVLKS